ncbi:CzcE family metal-binding protein [Cupriavidus sp. H18C1]|uniref:CzcE family metal-binding protein n=1 Tax=Cupriavidus sp. H18C1 TaxID=3241601 RepID=UPI003BB915EE
MKSVNVASGEAVAFADGDQSVAWQFGEFVHGSTVDLGDLFPSMPSARGVRVNIDRSQIFTGG